MSTATPRLVMTRVTLVVSVLWLGGCATVPPVVVPVPPSPGERLSWILRLENERMLADPLPPQEPELPAGDGAAPVPAPPPVFRPDLTGLVSDPEAQIRRRAALAIGRVGLADGVESLTALLGDPEAEVRQMAAFALGLLADDAAVDPLLAALDDPSPKVQGRAARALARVGAVSAAPAIGAMVRRHVTAAFAVDPEDLTYPQSDEVEAFRLGAYALGELRAFEPLAEVVLDESGQPILWWWPVAYALGRTEDPRAVPALATLAGVQGSVGVTLAARALGAIGDARAVEPVSELLDLDRRDRVVVASAVAALGAIDDPAAAAALDRFVRIRTLDPLMRLAAVDALAGHASAATVDVYTELLAHPWPPMRAAALGALARADPQAFLFVLSGLGSDPDWRVRVALAGGLRHAEPGAALHRLRVMLNDEDQRVLPAVLEALVDLRDPEAPRILGDRLRVPDIGVRKAVARLLGDLRPAGLEPALADAYAAGEPDPSYVARAAVLDALAAYDGEVARATLRDALADRDWAVRRRAAVLLGDLLSEGVPEHAIRPAPGLRRVDYTAPELLRPSFSPHVYLDTVHGTIELELAILEAPLTTENFMTLARQGFYDGLTFHRVVPGYVVQGGDPRADSEGGPGYTLRDEPNQLPFLRGTVGMALDWEDTGGSQFFITYAPQPQLDTRYTAFGHVVSGMEVVEQIQPGDRIERVLVWDGVQPFRNAEPEP